MRSSLAVTLLVVALVVLAGCNSPIGSGDTAIDTTVSDRTTNPDTTASGTDQSDSGRGNDAGVNVTAIVQRILQERTVIRSYAFVMEDRVVNEGTGFTGVTKLRVIVNPDSYVSIDGYEMVDNGTTRANITRKVYVRPSRKRDGEYVINRGLGENGSVCRQTRETGDNIGYFRSFATPGWGNITKQFTWQETGKEGDTRVFEAENLSAIGRSNFQEMDSVSAKLRLNTSADRIESYTFTGKVVSNGTTTRYNTSYRRIPVPNDFGSPPRWTFGCDD